MNKSEFLDILREQLDGNMPASELYSNIHYYDQYIEKEMASGKPEAEVTEQLGDPRLIAKTLIDADEATIYGNTYDENADYTEASPIDDEPASYSDEAPTEQAQSSYYKEEPGNDTQDSYYQEEPASHVQSSYYEEEPQDLDAPKVHHLDLTTWYGKAILIAIAAIVVVLVVTLLTAALPFLVVAALVIFIISYFRHR